MISKTKKAARSVGVAFAAAATLTLAVPTGDAFAIDHIE
ncbi:membrane protein [Streptomyces noursei ATCC 11455]|nr:membrane protein [Streptomyces noursei ATCC 11455]